jgi:septal ring factor EnvC (AmiA/AmiB activator)
MKLKKLQSYLMFAILGGFVAWMIFGQEPINVDVKGYETKISNLEKVVDSTYTLNSKLTARIKTMAINLEESNAKIKQLNGRIWTIKKQTDEKLISINTYSDDELISFFTERYRYLKDSITESNSKGGN